MPVYGYCPGRRADTPPGNIDCTGRQLMVRHTKGAAQHQPDIYLGANKGDNTCFEQQNVGLVQRAPERGLKPRTLFSISFLFEVILLCNFYNLFFNLFMHALKIFLLPTLTIALCNIAVSTTCPLM
jgi:hypothetical protein